MYLTIIILPLLSALIGGLLGRKIGNRGTGIITSILLVLTGITAWRIWYTIGLGEKVVYIKLYDWITILGVKINMGLQFDTVSAQMLVLITTISSLVHIYSTEYMEGDAHKSRFMSYLSMFTFFMIILVTGDNLMQLFIGWEGVGLSSYLLINFWFTRIQANKSAIKAMIVNRVGDIGVALGIMGIIYHFKAIDYSTIFSISHLYSTSTTTILGFSVSILTIIGVSLLIGAVGKSAQIGLHTWLPDAMEGPTPVSALIHAATMVTAGVFLIIRMSPLLEYTSTTLKLIIIVGGLTALMAATIGLVQNDIKKVIAYSTCSQLGYMVLGCGTSNYMGGLFHLINHGYFKALLFLSAGSIIHGLRDEQDMRKMGGMLERQPFTYSMMLIGSLSLMGFPFMTGYYSKDFILEWTLGGYTVYSNFGNILGTIGAFLTAYYSMRLIWHTFISSPNSKQRVYILSHEPSWTMTLPLFILSIGSIFIGYLFKDMMIGAGTRYYGNSIFVLPGNEAIIEAEFLSAGLKWIPVVLSILGGILGILIYLIYNKELIRKSREESVLYTFLSNKWNFDTIYNTYIGDVLYKFGHWISYKILDKGIIEYVGPYGLSRKITSGSIRSSKIQSGVVYNYGLLMIIFVVVYLQVIDNWGLIILNKELIMMIIIGIISI